MVIKMRAAVQYKNNDNTNTVMNIHKTNKVYRGK